MARAGEKWAADTWRGRRTVQLLEREHECVWFARVVLGPGRGDVIRVGEYSFLKRLKQAPKTSPGRWVWEPDVFAEAELAVSDYVTDWADHMSSLTKRERAKNTTPIETDGVRLVVHWSPAARRNLANRWFAEGDLGAVRFGVMRRLESGGWSMPKKGVPIEQAAGELVAAAGWSTSVELVYKIRGKKRIAVP